MSSDILLEHLDPDIGRTPQRDVPVLAALTRQLYERPSWMMQDTVPLEVDPATWKQAREEMAGIQRDRGFPLAMAAIDRVNFLLRGVPVVMKDESFHG